MNPSRLFLSINLSILLALTSHLAFASSQTVQLECRIQYQKGGDLQIRPVTLHYAAKTRQLLEVDIDGQPVYRFNLIDTAILTSMDSERIKIEFTQNKTLWRSNFRDILHGEGLCVQIKTK